MTNSLLQITKQKRGLILDPRTKMLLLITVTAFAFGGLDTGRLPFILPFFCILPFILLLIIGRIKQAIVCTLIYVAMYMVNIFLIPELSGFLGYVVLGCVVIMGRLLPGIVMGIYVISSTTVSEFTAAMKKLHVSEKIIIPLSVMFRFFPTINEEFASISAAMRMRGIRFGGGRIDKMIEYRLIPLMTCSAKIGEELSAAALTRGLGGEITRTNLCKIGFNAQDHILIALCIAAFIVTALTNIGLI